MKANSAAEQAECDRGTVMACRAIMATTVTTKQQITKVPPVATLENPPPSDTRGHLSAWELGEMEKFRNTSPHYEVEFNTCGYESKIPVGKKHYKPQMFAGSLHGLGTLKRKCQVPVRLPRQPRNHCGLGEVKSFGNVSYGTMQGVHQAGDRPVEAHGQVGLPHVQNDLSAGHHRRVEGQDHLHGGSFWLRSSRRSLRVPSMSPPTRREYKAATVDNKPRSPAKRTGLNRTPLQRRRKRPKNTRHPSQRTQGVLEARSWPEETVWSWMARWRQVRHAQEVRSPLSRSSSVRICGAASGILTKWIHSTLAGHQVESGLGSIWKEAPGGSESSRDLRDPGLHTRQGRCAAMENIDEEDPRGQSTAQRQDAAEVKICSAPGPRALRGVHRESKWSRWRPTRLDQKRGASGHRSRNPQKGHIPKVRQSSQHGLPLGQGTRRCSSSTEQGRGDKLHPSHWQSRGRQDWTRSIPARRLPRRPPQENPRKWSKKRWDTAQ